MKLIDTTFNFQQQATRESKIRESQFELQRLIAQFFIVFYHLFLCINALTDNTFYKALEIPMHIGVILFVLLSGYFGIRPSSKGFIKLLCIITIYSLPEIYFNLKYSESLKEIIKSILVFSHTHFWFIRTYLFLYLLSPIINHFIEIINTKQRIYIIGALFFICIYVGTSGGDPSLSDGKNTLNFMFIYLIGNSLKAYKKQFDSINKKTLLMAFIILSAVIVITYMHTAESIIGKIIWKLSFPYCSPLLLLNSILFFLIFTKFTYHSKIINWLAQSALAIYLIQENRPLFIAWEDNPNIGGIINKTVNNILYYSTNYVEVIWYTALATLFMMIFAITVDKLLNPIWSIGNKLSNRIYNYLGF